ncbi:MAG: LLM class flavin-dependent oxidoreductase, partial [Bacteroidia bacterium]|nr:LLM class flavin-dependent oxidoreductase [Bacteroidia bacterium]
IYTSGSTGKPKGCLIEHKNVVNFFTGMTNVFGEKPGTLLSLTNYTFDISVLELVWTLTLGYKVILQDEVREIAEINQAGKGKMDFSLFYFGNATIEDQSEKYKLLIEGAKYADQNGYTAIWTPERHFHEFGGIFPNPAVLGAALSTITTHLQIRAGSVVLPLNNTVRVAEEWSVIDNMSNGRAGIACASGWHANDFVLAPEHYQDRHKVMYKMIEDLKKLWSGEAIQLKNGSGILTETKIYPKPVQKELPIWITSAGNTDTFISAGKMGMNILTHLLGETVEELEAKIKAYKKAYIDSGHNADNAKVVLMLHTYIADSIEEAHEITRKPFIEYLRSSVGLIKNLAKGMGHNMEAEDFTEENLNDVLEYAFKRYVTNASLIGNKTTALKMLHKLQEIGVSEIACLIDFGVDFSSVMKSLQHVTTLKNGFNDESEDYSVSTQLTRHHVTHMQCTPSMAMLINSVNPEGKIAPSLKKILLGGEKLPLSLTKDIYSKSPTVEIYNMYGPTETTIWSTCTKIERNADKILIGKPIANTQVYILDKNMKLLPAGVPGEIYIGGHGVTRNYINNAELSAERFMSNPFINGERVYRTGDFGRWLQDGNIEYIERKDDQVKINGYRIELGEIENAFISYAGIETAVVMADRKTTNSSPRLVAYIKSKEKIINADLRRFLANTLPVYMIPQHFVKLDTLPLTPNGKIDRKALEKLITTDEETENNYVGPRNKTEERMTVLWAEILGVPKDKVGVRDNFFMIGGNSFIAIQLYSRIRKEFEVNIRMAQFFENPTIEESSLIIEKVILINTEEEVLDENNSENFVI